MGIKTEKEYEVHYYEVNYKLECKISSIINYFCDIGTFQSEDVYKRQMLGALVKADNISNDNIIVSTKSKASAEKINDEYGVKSTTVNLSLIHILRDLYSTRESIMLIEVDNLSEALERTDEPNRPMLCLL